LIDRDTHWIVDDDAVDAYKLLLDWPNKIHPPLFDDVVRMEKSFEADCRFDVEPDGVVVALG
jgi:hypothetical protein